MATLTISQLFLPLPSGVIPGVTPLNVVTGTWLAILQQNGANLNLPTTSWQSGGVTWTVEEMLAACLASMDGEASLRAQGGFLDFAATGTVTYVDSTQNPPVTITVPVTPDPSIASQNPAGALGWLDVLANSIYNTQRSPATYASGNLYVVNTTGSTLGTFTAGTFHVANSQSGATFKNSGAFTFSASASAGTTINGVLYGVQVSIQTSTPHGLSTGAKVYVAGVPGLATPWAVITVVTGTTFIMNNVSGAGTYVSGGVVYIPSTTPIVADVAGPVAISSPGQIQSTTTSVPGGFVTNFDPMSGAPWQSNVSLAAVCRASLQAASPNGAKGAYLVYALKAGTLLAAQSPPKVLTAPITRVQVYNSPGTGTATVVVANASGPVNGTVNMLVLGATNASPIVLHVNSTAGLATGVVGLVSGVQGNSAANGYWTMTVVDGSHISLNGSTGNGAWTQGGVVEAGDLGLVDSIIQAYADPNAVTALTQSASGIAVAVSCTVFVPLAMLADYGTNPASNKGTAAVSSLFATMPIGGVVLPGSPGVVDISEIEDAIFDAGNAGAGIYTISVQNLTLNGFPGSFVLSATQVATLGTLNIQAQGV
jgi:hypothetical protein